MSWMRKFVAAGAGLALMSLASVSAQELDPKVIGFKLPDQIEWKTNPAGTNRTAVLQGDPSKPGPYAQLLQWLPGNMSRPHFHPNDRFFIVLSGTWWVGSGPEFKPDATVPMPAGSHVIHYAKGVHYDGAKAEQRPSWSGERGRRRARRSRRRRRPSELRRSVAEDRRERVEGLR
jgi:hypothetical protein